MLNGLRVVRGPNWCWNNQDGGEGYVGTVREVTPKKIRIQWDHGGQLECRMGSGKYDLRIIDNAQVGIRHHHICDVCEKNINGMRYRCTCCYDYDLCSHCYHNNKHDLTHSFKRFDTARSLGIMLSPRLHARKCELRGIFKGAKVVRGLDWEWGIQDGGAGKYGVVLDITECKGKTDRSAATVKWSAGNTEFYRMGHKGYCDLQFIESASGGFYYPEHLPIMGKNEEEMEWDAILDTIDAQQIKQLEESEVRLINRAEIDPKMAYSSIIIDYNKIINASEVNMYKKVVSTRSQGRVLLEKLSTVSADKDIIDFWQIIKYMTAIPGSCYLDPYKHRYSENGNKVLVQQAKSYLENSFKSYMENLVNENTKLSKADLQSTFHLVYNFVSIRFKGEYLGLEDGFVDGRPLWPMVYYCLRSGDIPAAIYCLNARFAEFEEIIALLKTKEKNPQTNIIDSFEENIKTFYVNSIRNCTDPFKRIVWATLGGCDEISEAARTEDDYLWFKLNLVRFNDWARGDETYTDLQIITLEKSGEKFSLPHVYPKLLFLTGQFEMAIDFLFRTEKFKDHAVHMAVALHELDFLICSEDTNSPLVQPITNTTAFSLNFALLLETHVLNLELDLLPSALNYLFLLRHLENWEGRNVFEMNMANLIIRTKEYVKILGKIEPPTRSQNQRQQVCHREKALIDQFKVTEMFKGIVTEIQQQILSKNDGWEELINFYQTVNDQESTMHFMCSMLSKVAHLENQSDSLRDRLQEKADHLQQWSLNYYNGDQRYFNSFKKAKDLLVFFDLYRAKLYSEALAKLVGIHIIPLRHQEFEKKIQSLPSLSPDLVKTMPNIMLAAMTILLAQCEKIKKSPDPVKEHIKWAWEQANTITNFAERLPKEIIGDTRERLIQMEILMHS